MRLSIFFSYSFILRADIISISTQRNIQSFHSFFFLERIFEQIILSYGGAMKYAIEKSIFSLMDPNYGSMKFDELEKK